jgi:hypothetical protein
MISSCWRCFRFVVYIIVKKQHIECIVLVQVHFVFVFVFVSCMSLVSACHTLAIRLRPLRWSVLLAQDACPGQSGCGSCVSGMMDCAVGQYGGGGPDCSASPSGWYNDGCGQSSPIECGPGS